MIQCERCDRHFRPTESVCPFCQRSRPAVRALNTVGGLVTTFVLAACYGGPGGFTPPDTGDTDTDMDTDTDTDTTSTGDTATPTDSDGDGYFSDVDCNDTDPNIHPDQNEACDDGIDNDCDTLVDTNDPEC